MVVGGIKENINENNINEKNVLCKSNSVLGDGVRGSYKEIPEPYKDVQDIRKCDTLDMVLKDRNYW